MQDLANPDSLVYNDTMEAMELIQHIIEPTHQLGNTLDLNYTESLEVVKVLHCIPRRLHTGSKTSWNGITTKKTTEKIRVNWSEKLHRSQPR